MQTHIPNESNDSRRNGRTSGRRQKKSGRGWKVSLLAAAAAVALFALILPSLGKPVPPDQTTPPTDPVQTPTLTPTPVPTPTPAPTPTPEPVKVFDFTRPAPENEPVEMDYFTNALFIGDSRTEGLQLYSGIQGPAFYCYRGLTVFELQDRKVVEMDGGVYSVMEALGKREYDKIYISLGVNELGYFDNQAFEDTFRTFLRQLKELQPHAVIYLENLVPVNPEKCKSHKQPYYVTNKQIAAYNEIFQRIAPEEKVVLLDVAAALSDGNGVLAAENTFDGVHFTKAWYKTWLDFLMKHTVDEEEYWAGQNSPAEHVEGDYNG